MNKAYKSTQMHRRTNFITYMIKPLFHIQEEEEEEALLMMKEGKSRRPKKSCKKRRMDMISLACERIEAPLFHDSCFGHYRIPQS